MKIEEILKKLRFKEAGIILNAPKDIESAFKKAGCDTKPKGKSQYTILFIKNKSDFEKTANKVIKNIEHDSVFWIAYPKGTSSIKSDVNRDKLWGLVKPYDN